MFCNALIALGSTNMPVETTALDVLSQATLHDRWCLRLDTESSRQTPICLRENRPQNADERSRMNNDDAVR